MFARHRAHGFGIENTRPLTDGVVTGWGTIDGRSATVSLGRKTWDDSRGLWVDPPAETLAPVFTGVSQRWYQQDDTLKVVLRDHSLLTEKALQASFYGGSGGLEGDAALKNRPRPKTRGPVSHIDCAALLIDSFGSRGLGSVCSQRYATRSIGIADRRAEARMKGYVGEACPECANFTLVRNGTCLKCDTCGSTTGCS